MVQYSHGGVGEGVRRTMVMCVRECVDSAEARVEVGRSVEELGQ